MKNVMNLTPEEKIISEVDKLLEEIKTKDLAISGNEPDNTEQDDYIRRIEEKGLEIWIDLPDIDIKRGLIYKFRKIGLLEVLEYGKSDLGHTAEWFIFKTKQPNFDNFYNKWQEIKENPWIPTQDRPKKLVQFLNTGKLEEKYLKQESGQEKSPLQKEIKRKSEKAREKEEFKKEIIEEIQLNRTKEKQTKVAGIELPADPEVIEEYLNILNRIEKEKQRTPKGEPIAFPIPKGILIAKGVSLPEQETSILRKLDGLIKITQKTIPFIDPLGLDPYENIKTIRAVEIPDLDKFKNYRDKLSELKNQLAKSYKERKADAEARAKEIRRQFEELDEKQKAFEELGRQISSWTQKDFNVKQYREVIKKIDEQAEPIKRALEQLNAVYSGSVQNSLTSVLQRLTESIKPIEEQMKRFKSLFEYPEYPKEAFISSDVIRVRQGAETISKLENIEALLQGLLSKDKEKPKRVKTIKPEEFKEIKKITIIKMNNGKYLFAINDNYKEAKKIKNSEWWQIFIQEVRDRNLPYERRTDVKEIPKEMTDYFNYNKKCPIYFQGKYKLTNIFLGQSVDVMISSDIKTKTISEKKYLIRKQKQINSKK